MPVNTENNQFYSFGPFQLNVRERLLLRDGIRVPLQPKAFDILVMLVSNAGRLITKDELMHVVWGDLAVEEGNLPLNISLLRKALNDRADDPLYIGTVTRRGYRFLAEVKEAVPEQHFSEGEASPAQDVSEVTEFSESIGDISHIFVAIYQEAVLAERAGLRQLSVLGYRKALEVLIKDYARRIHPTEEEKILRKPIADCLYDYVDDERIKSFATQASWLSNHDAHLISEQEKSISTELKVLISVLVHYIEMQMSIEKLTPPGRRRTYSLLKAFLPRR